MHTVLYLLVIAGQLKFPEGDEKTQCPVRQIVYHLNRISLKTRQGRSLLHLACCASTPVDDFHTNDVCRSAESVFTTLMYSYMMMMNCWHFFFQISLWYYCSTAD